MAAQETGRPGFETPSYYDFEGCSIRDQVKDFDDVHNFTEFEERARSAKSRNFFLDFGLGEAWCAFDVSFEAWNQLLSTPRPVSFESRWINIWEPHEHVDLIKTLARKYKFSPRLTALMYASPNRKESRSVPADPQHHHHHQFHPHFPRRPPSRSSRRSMDAENAIDLGVMKKRDDRDVLKTLGHYDIVNSIWHWCSIDLGRRYLCLGYNSLYNVTPSTSDSSYSDLPNGDRVWSWLILCDDKTVISITEGGLRSRSSRQPDDMADTRKNLLNVFRQLSLAVDASERNAISIVPIRYALGIDGQEAIDDQSDSAGLLFYYLFDDWYTTYTSLVKYGHRYGTELKKLRENMMKHASLLHVDQLHSIGIQLSILRRMYESYELLIEKVLEAQKRMAPISNGVRSPSATEDTMSFLAASRHEADDQLGVYLSPGARVRFERLQDRIRLYVLSQIEESMHLKESLLSMNFNLIQIKESDSVERLTRNTILLAKVTIMFLPVSLLTSYFSVQIPDLTFTVRAYWIAFAVILAVSFIALSLFGRLSGTLEGKMVYQSITRLVLDRFKRPFGRRKDE